jgi:cell division protein FtsB
MRELTGEQLGSALRRLAAEVVQERRRVAVLERENRELRGEVSDLRSENHDLREQIESFRRRD